MHPIRSVLQTAPVARASGLKNFRGSSAKLHTLMLGLGLSACLPALRAANDAWGGVTDSLWSTATNWATDVSAPGAGETATFNGAGNGNTVVDLGAGVTVGSVVFDTASAAAYTIGAGGAGAQTLTLNTAGNAISVNAAVTTSQLFNANIALATTGNYVVSNSSPTNALTFAGGLSASSAGVKTFNVTGAGNTAISGAISSGSGNVSLFKQGEGTLTLSGGGTFSGNGTVDGAGFASSAVFRAGTTILSGGAYNNSNGEIVVGGVATHGGAGTDATLRLDNSASFTGITWLSIGRGNGNGVAASNLTLNNSASITSTNMSAGFNAGNTLNMPKGTITLNGSSSLTVAQGTYIAESAGSNFVVDVNGSSTFRATSTLGNGNQVARFGMADNAVGTLNVNGGTAIFERDLVMGYNGTGTGRLNLTSGTVSVASTIERWLIVNNLLGSKGEITIDGGDLNLNTNTDIRFSTNGAAAGTSSFTLNGGAVTGYTGNNNGVFSGTSVVDLNQGSTTGTINNTFNLNGGILTIGQVVTSQNSGTTTFNFNGGTLRAAAASANFVDLGGANQHAYLKTGGAVIDTNGVNVTIPQALEAAPGGSGGLTKNGLGTLTLSGVNTYTGDTVIGSGTLALASTGSIANSATIVVNGTFNVSAVAGFSVGAGQTLGGSGTVIGGVLVNGTLAAGNSPGELTFSGDLGLGSGSASVFEIDGTARGASYDGINVGGTLTYGGALSLVFGSSISAGTYFLFDGGDGTTDGFAFGTAPSGTFSSVSVGGSFAEAFTVPATITGSGWTAGSANWAYVFDNATGDLTISAVPEPSAFAALAGFVCLGLAGLRRRRCR